MACVPMRLLELSSLSPQSWRLGLQLSAAILGDREMVLLAVAKGEESKTS